MKVAAIQMVSAIAREANLARAHALLGEAAAAGAELAVLPEYFCMMGARDTDKLALRETAGAGTVQGFLADAAREFGLWIVGGTLPLETGDETHVFNSSLAYAPDGERVARYDKIHLFFFDNGRERYDERRVIAPGCEPVCFDLPSRDGHRWRIGMSVCYDLRFPELYRALARSRTWPGSSRRRRAARTRTGARPGASRWWWTRGARWWPSARSTKAWCSSRSTRSR
jgi:predicted amidohydrolase